MKANRFSHITISTLTIVMTFLLCVSATSIMAQNTGRTLDRLKKERIDKTISTPQSVEEFRAEMKQYLTDLGNALSNFEAIPAVREQFSKEGIDPVGAIDRAKANLEKIPVEDLVRMQEAYAEYPNWKQGPRVIYEISQKVSKKTYTQAGPGKTLGNVTIDVITPDTCPDISGTPSYADIAITEGFLIAAEAIMEGFPTDALTIAARVVSIAARAGLQAAVLAENTLRSQYEFCISPSTQDVQDIVDGAETAIIANDNGNTTSIINNDNTNKDTIVTNDNNNKTTIVNNDNANTVTILAAIEAAKTYIVTDAHANKDEMKNLLLRTQIEADLASTDGSTFVALYATPSSVCQASLNDKGLPQMVTLPGEPTITIPQCGLLDLVRSIVRDTIANVGAGTNAQSFFATAEAQRAAGKYKAAYASYRQAYKAASK